MLLLLLQYSFYAILTSSFIFDFIFDFFNFDFNFDISHPVTRNSQAIHHHIYFNLPPQLQSISIMMGWLSRKPVPTECPIDIAAEAEKREFLILSFLVRVGIYIAFNIERIG